MNEEKQVGVPVPADPSQWCEKSQRHMSFEWVKAYYDINYLCWRCEKSAVFTAADQKYTYEVKKAPIDQRRILCQDCWKQSEKIANDIRACETEWAQKKDSLRNDQGFLSRWLDLLVSREAYVPNKPNTATKNMLKKLLNAAAVPSVRQ
jgi:hypothetical protein